MFSSTNSMTTTIQQHIEQYRPITLAEMDSVALLNRVETKFVFPLAKLSAVLALAQEDYHVLSVDGVTLNPYKTLYFDTAEFDLYHHHHAGMLNRYKVRSREYMTSHTRFLEIKHKTNQKRTIKSRRSTDDFIEVIGGDSAEFVSQHYPFNVDELIARLWSNYTRITLVSLHNTERVTIDIALEFEWQGKSEELSDIVIVEIKRDATQSNASAFMRRLRDLHIRPMSMSKYCMGVVLLYPTIKQNNFKQQVRQLRKFSN